MKAHDTRILMLETVQRQDHEMLIGHEGRIRALEDRIEHHKRDSIGALEKFKLEINARLDTLDKEIKSKMDKIIAVVSGLQTEKNKLQGIVSVLKPVGLVVLGTALGHLWK